MLEDDLIYSEEAEADLEGVLKSIIEGEGEEKVMEKNCYLKKLSRIDVYGSFKGM